MLLVDFGLFIEKLIYKSIFVYIMVDLDVKDRKMLYYLSKNVNISHTQLGKLVGMSKNTVSYRIKQLVKEGIITNFSSVINTGALECTSFTMFLKFNKNPYKNKEILDYFKEHPFSIWVVTLSGTFDLYVEFITKNLDHLNNIITEIKEHFGEDLNYYETQLLKETLRVEHLIGDIYKNLELEELKPRKREFKSLKLDELDKKILKIISLNSDKSLIDIAKEAKSSWDVVRYRLKQMENAGIILNYFP